MKTAYELKKILSGAIKPVDKLSVTAWADKYRMLPSDSPEPGRWKTSRVPYMQEVMDAFTQEGIKRIVVKSAAQISKTECILNIVGRFVQLDPCTIMIIQPTLEMAADFSKSRLNKMIADTKILTGLFADEGKSRNANQTILSKFYTGGRIVLVGANSTTGLASRPVRILLCDEVDRYPPTTKEGDAVDLAAKRTSNFWNSRIALFSTPTVEGISRIDAEYKLGTQEIWAHQCPNCAEYCELDYRQMQTAHEVKRDGVHKIVLVEDVKWRCPYCGFEFDEVTMKNSAQKYLVTNPDALKNGIRSFYINGFSSPWLSWKEIMREWLEARGNPSRESVVFNTRFGLSYKMTGFYDDENIFLQRREDYEAQIPAQVLILTAAVDVQQNRLEYEIAGWSEGLERWGILRGVVRGETNRAEVWQNLDAILERNYYLSNGSAMTVARTFIDSGYRTDIVYEYCRANVGKNRFAIKGKSGMGIPLLFKYTNPMNSGIMLTTLGVDAGKQEVFSNLAVTSGLGFMHFPRDDEFLGVRGYDSEYFKQLIAEKKVIKKSAGVAYETWETVSSHARNESLDLAVYNLAAIQSLVGKNPAEFWTRRRGLLSGDSLPKKKSPVKAKKFRTVDIWL